MSDSVPETSKEATEYKEKGNKSFKDKNFDEAIENFTAAIKLKDNDATFYCNRSIAYGSLGKWNLSLNDSQMAIKLDNKYVKAYCRSLKAYLMLSKIKEMKSLLLSAIKNCGEQNEFKIFEADIINITGLPLRPRSTDFEVIETLGEGNFSTIVRVKLKKTGVEYAVKMIEKMKIDRIKYRHPNIMNEIYMEKRVLNKIDHPNISTLLSTFQDTGTLYYQMDLMKGGEFFNHMKDNDGTMVGVFPSRARYILNQLINALEYLHQRGIVHRDLKPENMMLTANGNLKLIDFGTAKDLINTDLNGPEFVGTPEYMAPQTISSEVAGPEVDLWALGVVTYQAFLGILPFEAASPYLTFLKIQRGYLPFLMTKVDTSGIPGLQNFLKLCFEFDPAKRLENCITTKCNSSSNSNSCGNSSGSSSSSSSSSSDSKINYDKLRKQVLFCNSHSETSDTSDTSDTSGEEEVGLPVMSLKELCIRKVADATDAVATIVATRDYSDGKNEWCRSFDLSSSSKVSVDDIRMIKRYLMRRGRLQSPLIYRLFWQKNVDSRCNRILDGTREYIGYDTNRQLRWKNDFTYATMINPSVRLDEAGKDTSSLQSTVTAINRSRPTFVICIGNFVSSSSSSSSSSIKIEKGDEEIETYEKHIHQFRTTISRISETIPVLFVAGPNDIHSIQDYDIRFGSSFYLFCYGGIRVVVMNTNLLADPSLAPEIAEEQDIWLTEQIEQCKLSSTHTVFCGYHSWKSHTSNSLPESVIEKWLPTMQHSKIRHILCCTDLNENCFLHADNVKNHNNQDEDEDEDEINDRVNNPSIADSSDDVPLPSQIIADAKKTGEIDSNNSSDNASDSESDNNTEDGEDDKDTSTSTGTGRLAFKNVDATYAGPIMITIAEAASNDGNSNKEEVVIKFFKAKEETIESD